MVGGVHKTHFIIDFYNKMTLWFLAEKQIWYEDVVLVAMGWRWL